MPTTYPIAETDEGRMELKGNELLLYDKTSGDPVAWRSRSHNGGMAKWSLDAWIGGQWVEIGYLFGKRDERPGFGNCAEFEFWHKLPGDGSQDSDYVRSVSIRHDGVVFHRGSRAPSSSARIVHEGGRFVTIHQNDGHIVTLDTNNSADEATWEPVWSNWGGLIKALPWI